MRILHISAECYPAAKAGGLGDVVGALPKYLNRAGNQASVIIPKYRTHWIEKAETKTLFEGTAPYDSDSFSFSVEQVEDPDRDFPLYLVDIPDRFNREGIYLDTGSGKPFWDEMDRFFSFQIAVLEWLVQTGKPPEIIHCHDHHTSLVPFMMTQCFRYQQLQSIPTVVTIHNGEYQGRYDLQNFRHLPAFDLGRLGLLDWDGCLNSLAAGIKCAWHVTTVSNGYLKELMEFCHGLEQLLRMEQQKSTGIVNGIDWEVWNPETDPFLEKKYGIADWKAGKQANKIYLCRKFNLDSQLPLFSFIGRLVREKGADLIADLADFLMKEEDSPVNLLVLGTGDADLHQRFSRMDGKNTGYFSSRLEYNEELAHKIYAGSDFLIMPSRVEPCGLNQMYAMRYGTVPVVRATGGLSDTVRDLSRPEGYGILFETYGVAAAVESIHRAIDCYKREKSFAETIQRLMNMDVSWEKSSSLYERLYKQLMNKSLKA